MTVFTCTVYGDPIPQGSKTCGIRGGKAIMWDDNKNLGWWRDHVEVVARARTRATARATRTPWAPMTGPLQVVLLFALPKPARAPVRTRTWPAGRGVGDLDKLTRAVFDALEAAGVMTNDAQVCTLLTTKDYPGVPGGLDKPGIHVTITELDTRSANWWARLARRLLQQTIPGYRAIAATPRPRKDSDAEPAALEH